MPISWPTSSSSSTPRPSPYTGSMSAPSRPLRGGSLRKNAFGRPAPGCTGPNSGRRSSASWRGLMTMADDRDDAQTEHEELRSVQLAIAALLARAHTLAIGCDLTLDQALTPIEAVIEHFKEVEENAAMVEIVEERFARADQAIPLVEFLEQIGLRHLV